MRSLLEAPIPLACIRPLISVVISRKTHSFISNRFDTQCTMIIFQLMNGYMYSLAHMPDGKDFHNVF
jgi:hypothetical protein